MNKTWFKTGGLIAMSLCLALLAACKTTPAQDSAPAAASAPAPAADPAMDTAAPPADSTTPPPEETPATP